MKEKVKFAGLISLITVMFFACGSDSGTDSHTRLIKGFGTDLRKSLPEVTPSAKKGSPADAGYETYNDAQDYGGIFQRVLGDDPLSIFFTVDMTDRLIGELLYEENPDIIFGGSRELILPFFGDSITFLNTFMLEGSYSFTFTITYEDQSESMTASIDDFRGGYSDDMIAILYHIDIPGFADGTTIYSAERNSEGKLYIRYASYGSEIHEGTSPFTTSNRRNVYFLRDIEDGPYTYKSAGKTIRTDNDDAGVFSIIMGGGSDPDGFIIRRRAYYNDGINDMFIDQLFATTYDSATHHVAADPLEEQHSAIQFDIDGGGFSGGGLGDTITLSDPDAVYLNIYSGRVAAHEMPDFSEPTDLPQSVSNVTPSGW